MGAENRKLWCQWCLEENPVLKRQGGGFEIICSKGCGYRARLSSRDIDELFPLTVGQEMASSFNEEPSVAERYL